MLVPAKFRLFVLIALCLLVTPVCIAQHKPPAPIVITHATVINPGTSSVHADQVVVITGDHITSVSDAAKFQSPKNASVIDATGQYLIPGLWDMHVHSAFGNWFPGGRDIILPLFIANGVTGVCDMGGDTPVLMEWRKEIIQGESNLKLLLSTQDQQRRDALTRLLARSQTWQVPTLAWQRGGTFLDQRDLKHQPLDKYVPAYWRDVTWRRFTDEMMPGLLRDPLELRQEYFARNLQMIEALHHAGVPFMAGTDAAPGVYIMPGFSLHDELANFLEAGFTPMESLQTATSNPAKFLGMEASMGSIE